MINFKSINVYVKAIFSLASEQKQLLAWSNALAFMTTVVTENKFLQEIDNNLGLPHDKLFQAMKKICEKNLTPSQLQFLQILIRHKNLALLPAITARYDTLRAQQENIITITVMTAHPLEIQTKEYLQTVLRKFIQKKILSPSVVNKDFKAVLENNLFQINLSYIINPALIGGIMLQCADTILDCSIQGRLHQLLAHFKLDTLHLKNLSNTKTPKSFRGPNKERDKYATDLEYEKFTLPIEEI